MYQINLLKGRQLPDNHLGGIILTGLTFVIPIVLAFAISIGYFKDSAGYKVQQEKLSDYEFQLRELDEAKARADGIVTDIQRMSGYLSDVREFLGRHIQWSDILLAISENLPDTLFVDKLDVIRKTVTKTVDQRHGAKKKIHILIPARTLVVSLYSVSSDGEDGEVRRFQKKLFESEAFQRSVKDVVIAAREPDKISGKDVVRYELNCVFKIAEN